MVSVDIESLMPFSLVFVDCGTFSVFSLDTIAKSHYISAFMCVLTSVHNLILDFSLMVSYMTMPLAGLQFLQRSALFPGMSM